VHPLMARALTMADRRKLADELRVALDFVTRDHDENMPERSAYCSLGVINGKLTRAISMLETGYDNSGYHPTTQAERRAATRRCNAWLRSIDKHFASDKLRIAGAHTE
jgi:hypothetical protein